MLKIKRAWKKGGLSSKNMENEAGSGQRSVLHKTVFYKQACAGDGIPTALHDSLEFSSLGCSLIKDLAYKHILIPRLIFI